MNEHVLPNSEAPMSQRWLQPGFPVMPSLLLAILTGAFHRTKAGDYAT